MEPLEKLSKNVAWELEKRRTLSRDSKRESRESAMEELSKSIAKKFKRKAVSKYQLRRLYNEEHGKLPEIELKSMSDVDRLLEKHKESSNNPNFKRYYRQSQVYFEVKDDKTRFQRELADIHDMSQRTVSKWQRGYEPRLVSDLRRREENRIIKEWADTMPAKELQDKLDERRRVDEAKQRGREAEIERTSVRATCRINEAVIKKAIGNSSINKEQTSKALGDIYEKSKVPDGKLYIADIEKQCEFTSSIHRCQREIDSDLQNRFGLERDYRIGVVDGNLYVWVSKTNPESILGNMSREYFYFKDQKDLQTLSDNAKRQIGLDSSERESIKHLNELLEQLGVKDKKKSSLSDDIRRGRVEGGVLRFLLDSSGLDKDYLSGRLKKIAGVNGQGGIHNPNLLQGKELEIAKARLIATALSDCHIAPSGKMEYYEGELDRLERMKENLSTFGDMEFSVAEQKKRGVYRMGITGVIGRMLIDSGVPSGDKTIQNPELPETITNGLREVQKAYFEDLIPEEGNFHPGTGFSWNRSHALFDNDERIQKYGFQNKISEAERDLIQEFGKSDNKCYYLTWKKLEELSELGYERVATTAKNIIEAVKENPNRLIEGEVELARRFGIKVKVRPVFVRLIKKSGRVSVYHSARTSGKEAAKRWAELFPPNDIKNRKKIDDWLAKM